MSVLSITANPGASAQTGSAYGAVAWSPGAANLNSYPPPGSGCAWIYWQIQSSLLPPGQAFTGMSIGGGSAFAPAGRNCTLFAKLSKTPLANGSSGDTLLNLTGGAGYSNVPGIYSPSIGLTTNDVIAGNCYFGLAAITTPTGPALLGIIDSGALDWELYFGADTPTPPSTEIAGTLANPVGNNTPGKLAGIQQFEALTFTHTQPRPRNSLTFVWRLPTPTVCTFADTGTNGKTVLGGVVGNPSQPYVTSSGLINIPAGTPPQIIAIEVADSSSGLATFILNSTLRIAPSAGGGFTEF